MSIQITKRLLEAIPNGGMMSHSLLLPHQLFGQNTLLEKWLEKIRLSGKD